MANTNVIWNFDESAEYNRVETAVRYSSKDNTMHAMWLMDVDRTSQSDEGCTEEKYKYIFN